ncbi:MAG: deaminase [Candidatus Shapirobacteria bacterium]
MPINYPYLPAGKTLEYVPATNPFMLAASEILKTRSCIKQPTGAVVVKNSQIIGRGSNAGILVTSCPRIEQGYQTGQGWHLCQEICRQEGHAEIMAIKDALTHGHNPQGADLYLEGHWWCCQNCWDFMLQNGIQHVYLRSDSYQLYKR